MIVASSRSYAVVAMADDEFDGGDFGAEDEPFEEPLDEEPEVKAGNMLDLNK